MTCEKVGSFGSARQRPAHVQQDRRPVVVQQLTQAINVDQRSSHREESNASRYHLPPAGALPAPGWEKTFGPGSLPFAVVRPLSRADLPGRVKRGRSLRLTRPVRPAVRLAGRRRRDGPGQRALRAEAPAPHQPALPHQPRPRLHWSSCGDNPCTRSNEREFSIPTGFRPVAQSAPAGLTSPPANTPAPPPPVSKIHSPAAKSVVFADFAARTRSTPPPARPRPYGTPHPTSDPHRRPHPPPLTHTGGLTPTPDPHRRPHPHP